ncbi:MAG: CAP domain-containing protein [Caldimonas sp.]
MPTRLRFLTGTPSRERAQFDTGLQGVVLALTLALSTAAQSGGPIGCGIVVSPEAATQLLNDVRQRGAVCSTGATSTAATLAWNDRLAEAALVQAREMARLDRMSHRDSRNRGLAERLQAVGYPLGIAVENVAVGYPSIDDVVDAWLDSEGHCANLMNAAVREFGIACFDAVSTGAPEERRYWALVLGVPPRSR